LLCFFSSSFDVEVVVVVVVVVGVDDDDDEEDEDEEDEEEEEDEESEEEEEEEEEDDDDDVVVAVGVDGAEDDFPFALANNARQSPTLATHTVCPITRAQTAQLPSSIFLCAALSINSLSVILNESKMTFRIKFGSSEGWANDCVMITVVVAVVVGAEAELALGDDVDVDDENDDGDAIAWVNDDNKFIWKFSLRYRDENSPPCPS